MTKIGTGYVAVDGTFDELLKGADKATADVKGKFRRVGKVPFDGDFTKFNRDVDKTARGVREKFRGVGRAAGIGITGGLAVGAAGFYGITRAASGALSAFYESQRVGRQTAAVLKSTGGAAGVSAKDIDRLTDALSRKTGIDDEVIQQGENVLLTFTNVRNEVGKGNRIFDRATGAAADMSAALGQDMQSSVIQLGKALNDPVKGVTALSRVGVSFTKEQKDQIKTLVESGKTMDAQKLILRELNKEFGGTAEAVANPLDKAKVSIGNMQEALGRGLAPAANAAATALDHFVRDHAPELDRFGERIENIFSRKDLKFGEKLSAAWGAGKQALEPIRRDISRKLGELHLGPKLRHAVDEAAPQILDAAGTAARKAAGAFVQAWLHSDWWAKVFTGLFLAKKLGIFSTLGKSAGTKFGASFAKWGTPLIIGAVTAAIFDKQVKDAGQWLADIVAGKPPKGFETPAQATATLKRQVAGQERADRVRELTAPVQVIGTSKKIPVSDPRHPHHRWWATHGKPPYRRRDGGIIPGSGRGDKVPLLGEPGEYVVRRDAVAKYGRGLLESINAQRFKTGGQVQPVTGLTSPSRRRGFDLMQQIWNSAAGFYGRPAGTGMPRVKFWNDDMPLVGTSSSVADTQKAFVGSRRMEWPDWINKDFLKRDPAMLGLLLHEWAHYFQKRGLTDWQAEGGATLFARRIAPNVFASLGIPYSNLAFNDDQYVGEMKRAKRLGEEWIMQGQFGSGRGMPNFGMQPTARMSTRSLVDAPGAGVTGAGGGTHIAHQDVHVKVIGGGAPDWRAGARSMADELKRRG